VRELLEREGGLIKAVRAKNYVNAKTKHGILRSYAADLGYSINWKKVRDRRGFIGSLSKEITSMLKGVTVKDVETALLDMLKKRDVIPYRVGDAWYLPEDVLELCAGDWGRASEILEHIRSNLGAQLRS